MVPHLRTTLRPPVPVTTTKGQICDLLNAYQILYMTGLKDKSKVDPDWLMHWLNLAPPDFDATTRSLLMLFKDGLELREITPHDLDFALDPEQGYCHWRDMFSGPSIIPQQSRADFEEWRQFGLQLRQVRHDFARRITTFHRGATTKDLQSLISDGWLVIVREIRGTWGIRSLFYGTADGICVYSPLRGIQRFNEQLLSRFDTTALSAWRRPLTDS